MVLIEAHYPKEGKPGRPGTPLSRRHTDRGPPLDEQERPLLRWAERFGCAPASADYDQTGRPGTIESRSHSVSISHE